MTIQPTDPAFELLKAAIQRHGETSDEVVLALHEVCARAAVRSCLLKGLRDEPTQLDIAAAAFEDALSFLGTTAASRLLPAAEATVEATRAAAEELVTIVEKAVNRYAQREYRWRGKTWHLDKEVEGPSPSPALDDAEQEQAVASRLLSLSGRALAVLRDSHPRYAGELERFLASTSASLPPPGKRPLSAFRKALTQVIAEHLEATGPSDPSHAIYASIQQLVQDRNKATLQLVEFVRALPGGSP